MKIYKYFLRGISEDRIGKPQQILMLRGAEPLAFRFQNSPYFGSGPTIWALVDETLRPDDTEMRSFILYFTGDTIGPDTYYLGTDFSPDGLVYHCFEFVE